jgi:hypothetical protein
VTTKSNPKQPRDHDQDVPRRRGERIDDERDKKPERDEIPDVPGTEPQPVPIKEPVLRPKSRPRRIVDARVADGHPTAGAYRLSHDRGASDRPVCASRPPH